MRVVAHTNLFDPTETLTADVPEGQTIRSIVGEVDDIRVLVGASEIPRGLWGLTKPHNDEAVHIYVLPHGGDNGVLRAVAGVIVAILSAYTGGAVGAAYGSAWGAAAGAGVSIAGSLVINALIPPQQPDLDRDDERPDRGNSITGGQNRANRFGVIPRTYGRVRWFPPLAANYYTEAAGSNQYLRMLVCLGYGPLEVGGQTVGEGHSKVTSVPSGTLSIGETDIGEFDGVSYEIGTPGQITLYTRDIEEIAPQVVLETDAPKGHIEYYTDGESATRTTEPNADEISVDLLFPLGLFRQTSAGTWGGEVHYTVEYADAGSGNWTTIVDGLANRKTRDAFRINHRWSVPTGQYDVRITRVKTWTGTGGNFDPNTSALRFDWSALRTIRDETPFDVDNTVLMALRIKATDQMEGVVDQLRVWQTAVLPVWDGSTFTEQATRNPAWAYLDTFRGPQVRRPVSDSRLDLTAIKEWADWCEANNWWYDFAHDTDETLPERAIRIASAGMASFSPNLAGKISVIREKDQEPSHLITPRNSWGFSATRKFERVPHALRISYISGTDWQQDEVVVFDDGYDASNATRYEHMEVEGITEPDLVWRYGRRHLAQMRLRPETYTVQMDFEAARFTRGDTVLLAHDVMLVGIGSARIRAINGSELTLDHDFTLETSTDYVARVQVTDTGSLELRTVTSSAGTTNVIELNDVTGLAVDDLVTIGESDRETLECKVSGITYSPDLEAEVTLVPRAPGILDADSGTIPEHDPKITRSTPIEQARPQPPTIELARSDQTTLQVTEDGGFRPGLVVGWNISSDRLPIDQIELRYRTGEEWSTEAFGPTARQHIISGLQADDTARIEMRCRSLWGTWSVFSPTRQVNIEGAGEPPTDVADFDLTVQGDEAILSWERAPDVDVRLGGRVLVYHGSEADLSTATPLDRLPGSASTASVPLLPGWYLAVFEDAGGRQSENPTMIFTDAPQASKYNAVETFEEPPTNGTAVSGININSDGHLELTAAEGIYETGTVVDLGQIYSARVWAELTTSTYLISELISNRGLISTWDTVSGTENVRGPRAQMFVRTTTDDPSGSPTWTDWKRLTAGVYRARAYQVRIRLARDDENAGISVTNWKLNVDMPDRVESEDEVSVPSGGTRIDFSPAFRAKPKIAVTIEDAEVGDHYRRTNSDRTGFDLEILDNGENSVARTVDWVAVGYGYEE